MVMKATRQQDRRFMELAIHEMGKSPGDTKVGAVLVVDDQVVATGFKTQNGHAERVAIEQANEAGVNLRGAVLYTTLEPCVQMRQTQAKTCCSDLIVAEGIRKVFIGHSDPNPRVLRKGWRRLCEGNIELLDFPEDLRKMVDERNPFAQVFSQSIGPESGMTVDVREPETVRIQFSETDVRTMTIRWSWSGKNQAFAYNSTDTDVALAREATEFAQIDDPGAFRFGDQARVSVGEIVVFRHAEAYLLAKVLESQAGEAYGDKHYLVKFRYQIRLR
jgi:diaminohydroxyphosphoribosylaminopyrimidine deaminase/5-amino-6-(5-phosphoribosylamino)uracil reductase